jgi:predicted DNA-binding ArsR family transcriptional regulator
MSPDQLFSLLTLDLVRIISSAFSDKKEFQDYTDNIAKDLEEVNQYAALIGREGIIHKDPNLTPSASIPHN